MKPRGRRTNGPPRTLARKTSSRPLPAPRRLWVNILLRGVLCATAAALISPRGAAAQQGQQRACEAVLPEAEAHYRQGAFDEAITLLTNCLNQEDVPDEDAVQAYRLLSLAYLRQDQLEEARLAVVNLLGLAPDYEPDPVRDPPPYVSLVTIVRQELQPAQEALEPMDLARDTTETPPPPPDVGLPEEEAATADRGGTPWYRRTTTWLATVGGAVVVGGLTWVLTGLGGGGDGGDGGGTEPPPPDPLPPPPGLPPN